MIKQTSAVKRLIGKELKAIINSIIEILDVESIFLNCIELNDTPCYQVLIIKSNTCTMANEDLNALISKLFVDYTNYKYILMSSDSVKHILSIGGIYLSLFCSPLNQIYIREALIYDLYPANILDAEIVNKGKNVLDQHFTKSKKFLLDGEINSKNGPLEYSAYLIHQSIELAYRGLELALLGREHKAHSLKSHQRFVGKYLPTLATIIPTNDPLDISRFQLFEKANLGYRYVEDFKIQKEDLELFIFYANQLQRIGKITFDHLVRAFIGQRTNSILSLKNPIYKSEILETVKDTGLDQILEQIIQSLPVDSIYCFGKRSKTFENDTIFNDKINEQQNHWYLLVVTTRNHQGNTSLQIRLNENPNLKATVTLLMHSRKSINRALQTYNRFFVSIFQNSTSLYERPNLNKILIGEKIDQPYKVNEAEILWRSRLNNAEAFYEATEYILLEYREVSTSLIAQSVEQACLGLIYVFMGYKPHKYSLSFLINLCSNFEPRFQKLFPRDIEEDEMYFNALEKAHTTIKHGSPSVFSDEMEPEYLKRRCRLFIDLAEDICKKKFELLNLT